MGDRGATQDSKILQKDVSGGTGALYAPAQTFVDPSGKILFSTDAPGRMGMTDDTGQVRGGPNFPIYFNNVNAPWSLLGNGRDGNLTIGSDTTFNSVDKFFVNLTLNAGHLLGVYCRLFVTGTLTVAGTLNYDGSNAVGSTGGATTSGGDNVESNEAGADGGTGDGSNANPGAFGGNSGAGGTGAGHAGGNAVVVSPPQEGFPGELFTLLSRFPQYSQGYTGGSGGSSGGGDGSNSGGGGGAGGGAILIVANQVIVNPGGLIAARGGNGGTPAAGNCGGGGGGGGGAIFIVCRSYTGALPVVTGGLGGGKTGTGTVGNPGLAGAYGIYQI